MREYSAIAKQVVAAAALTFFSTAQAILVELAKVDGKMRFHTPSAVFYTEILKLFIALTVWGMDVVSGSSNGIRLSWRSLTYAIPAALFIAQNNLVFLALSLLDPPTFQVWACFKLIPAGVLARIFLRQRRTAVQWCALLLLMLGMVVTKVCRDGNPVAHESYAGMGILVLLFNGCLSASSGVFNEWLIKFQDPSASLMLKNAHIYFFGALVSLPSCKSPLAGGLDGFDAMAVVIVIVNAATGLCVSLVLKYADNLIKNYCTSVAVILSTLASVICCGFSISQSFVVGVAIVLCAMFLYFGEHNKLLVVHDTIASQEPASPHDEEALLTDSEKELPK
mmetsp:Transcript_63678/g.105886  ORF Transcript_63678/g.105886 Transcript_63678/m.105886 type:complete len:337 (+) Transcript_63678:115-1125(+)|eukprot:CAMPEP_0119313114 /NCGR_PEP_ID=MMETSP1333-20130426/27914_1 /TAXON_ID=418940 /ORGANISM="Scyphosphaera apsteinii, Strain RCC1455" /LENGTH=336 /DNA_ID=CAMNT_0007317863 /DNA_START=108 /DNA_END=1118 /DNA_ORIENTATION=+